MQRKFIIGATLTLAVAAGVGVASASIPSSLGAINGCYSKVTGALKVIDSNSSCNGLLEKPLTWNQTGPAGPQGVPGPQGVTGPAGPAGIGGSTLDYISSSLVLTGLPANQTFQESVDCPTGETPVNLVVPDGGFTQTSTTGDAFMRVLNFENLGTSGPQGYRVTVQGSDGPGATYTFPYQLICARNSS